jgi:clan AA aspartic protease
MILGIVNANREATIQIVILGLGGEQHEAAIEIVAIIDTGFTGFLTVPPALIQRLDLPWLCREPGILADGSVENFDVYVATVMWNGERRTIEVEAVESESLLGMGMLERYSLFIEVEEGGSVAIGPLGSPMGSPRPG